MPKIGNFAGNVSSTIIIPSNAEVSVHIVTSLDSKVSLAWNQGTSNNFAEADFYYSNSGKF
jgi:hypothetical protein